MTDTETLEKVRKYAQGMYNNCTALVKQLEELERNIGELESNQYSDWNVANSVMDATLSVLNIINETN